MESLNGLKNPKKLNWEFFFIFYHPCSLWRQRTSIMYDR